MTSRKQELEENARWKLRDKYREIPIFNQLVHNEFLSIEEQQEWRDRSVRNLVQYAFRSVPYYRELSDRLNLKPEDIQTTCDLVKLPLLGKRELYDHSRDLKASSLPGGERIFGTFSSSGTTGRPAKILHTTRSNAMFSYLSHRQWRFMRADPGERFATIRLPSQIPRTGGRVLADGSVKQSSGLRGLVWVKN